MTIRYTKEHEWVRVEGDAAVVGISDYAQTQLGEIVFVEVPDTGTQINKGDEACVIESVKAASEIYSPVSGNVTETNGDLEAEPSKVNEDSTGEGWLYKLTLSDASELDDLMGEADYLGYVAELG
ncbi:MAG: glycine cleavage system protein GcvH [Alphaproteobacteria bacterium]|jgi:glycine cleavage system H protein|nr:glycine cleavage system protein GcvH [Alphaproteobacteria bacterium]